MLLFGVELAEIVMVGETIEDGLKIGKIIHVYDFPGSSGLLKKKREYVSVVSIEWMKTPRRSSSYQGRSRPSQSLYHACYTQADYQYSPHPSYQNNPSSNYQNTPPHSYQNAHPPTYQNTPHPFIKFHP